MLLTKETSTSLLSLILGFAILLLADCAAATTEPSTRPADSNDTTIDEQRFEDIDLYTLEIPTVVTATRREQKITTVPYAVSVITAEDIRWSGARSVPDALRLATGVDVAEISFSNYGVSPRGSHGLLTNTTLVLVDGRQLFDSMNGGTWWGAWPFQLEDIERIEVIRGPAGVTWGANTCDGVINIITKDPADQLGLTFTAGGGSRGTHKEHLGYAFADKKLRLRISGEYEASDGFLRGGSFLRQLEDDHKGGRMGLHAIYEPSPSDVFTLSAGSALLDGGYPPPSAAVLDRRRNPDSQANFLLGRWAHQVDSANQWELTGYVNDFQVSSGVAGVDHRYQQLAFQFGQVLRPDESHTFTWGIDSRVDLEDTTNADPPMTSKGSISTAIIGLYLQDEWRLAPKWTLNLGGRVDYEFYGGFQPSARAALSYKLTDDAVVYGAISRTFTMAPAALRFMEFPMLNGLVYCTSERDIDAQTGMVYELGYRGRPLKHLETSVNLFWHEYDDRMAWLPPRLGPPGLIRLHLDNAGAASLYGVELEARYAVNPRLTLLANYTLQRLDWQSQVPFINTENISPPKHKFMVGARYSPTDDLHLSTHLYYVDAVEGPNPTIQFLPMRVDPYFRLDLRAEHDLWNDRASIAVGVRNLLDPHHPEGTSMLLNNAEVPRMVYAEFRLRLK